MTKIIQNQSPLSNIRKNEKILTFLSVSSSCISAEIKISELDESKEQRCESTFESWIPLAENQAQTDEFTKEKNMFNIFPEQNHPKVRSIFIKKIDGLAHWTLGSMDESQVLKQHRTATEEGYVLVSMNTHKQRRRTSILGDLGE